jgi:hypothetical protein
MATPALVVDSSFHTQGIVSPDKGHRSHSDLSCGLKGRRSRFQEQSESNYPFFYLTYRILNLCIVQVASNNVQEKSKRRSFRADNGKLKPQGSNNTPWHDSSRIGDYYGYGSFECLQCCRPPQQVINHRLSLCFKFGESFVHVASLEMCPKGRNGSVDGRANGGDLSSIMVSRSCWTLRAPMALP